MNKLGRALAAALLGLALPLCLLAAEPITVGGRVVGPGDAPVAGATITLSALENEVEHGRRWLAREGEPPPLATARTDAGGAFRLSVSEPLFALVTVRAAGFVAVEATLEPLIESVELPIARLSRSRELAVRVAGAGGQPLAGAWIAVSPLGAGPRLFADVWPAARRWGRTGADGILRVERGEDEAVLVRAIAPGSGEVERESVRGSSLALELPATTQVAIHLRGPQSMPVAGAVLFGGKGSWPLALSDAAGKLAVPSALAAGRLTVRTADGAALETSLPPAKAAGLPIVLDLPAAIRIAGRVVEAPGRRPLAGALVWPHGSGGLAVKTRGDGAYELALPGPRVRLRAGAVGYLPGDAGLAGIAARGPTFALYPALAVRGTVVDEAGRPVAGAEIEARVDLQSRMGRRYSGASLPARARTGSDGRFELGGMEAGSAYELRVTGADYAPVGVDLASTQPVHPWPPQRIVLSRGVSAYGRVLDGVRQPVAGAALELRSAPEPGAVMRMFVPGPDDPNFVATSGADGRFELAHLPPGRYDLEVEARGFAPLTVPGLELAVAAPRRDLGIIVVRPGATLEGVTVDAAGQPLAEARVWAYPTGSSEAMTAGFRNPEDEPQAVSAADGRFRIEDLRPDERVEVVALRHGYARGRAAGVEPPVAEPLRIVLAPASRLSGRVRDPDGKGIAGATVLYRRVLGSSRGFSSPGGSPAISDLEGRFTIESVEPGTVMLRVSAVGFVAAARDDLQVPAGQDVTGLEVILQRAARVAGRVLDAAGEPAPMVTVAISENTSQMMRTGPSRAPSDGDGYYSLESVEPGLRTVVARHDDGRRAAAELEVRPGDNTLDLRLPGGVEVSGVVRDAEGLPLGGAGVELGGRFWANREAKTLADGSFLLGDVVDGTYELTAQSEGFAPSRIAVEVAGTPVGGLELRLGRGGQITGQVRGLAFADLPRLHLFAWTEGQLGRRGAIDFEGRYRVVNLAPGNWTVSARLENGRAASGKVALAEGQAEATVDLEFGQGWMLSGRVSSAGQPVAGAVVGVRGRDVNSDGEGSTGQAGEFKIQDLKSGTFELTVHTPAAGLAHSQELALTGDREIDIAIATGEVRGLVLDSVDRAPLAGAAVSLQAPASTEQRFRFGRDRSTETDARGVFRFVEAAAGSWVVVAERGGYARAERSVAVGAGAGPEEIELLLQPTEGVSLEARTSAGGVPEFLFVTATDGAGRIVAGGNYSPADSGRVRLGDVPAGSWELLVNAPDSAVVRVQVVAPGPVVPVSLPPGATVQIVVPELADSDLLGRASVTDAVGLPFRTPDWGGTVRSEWLVRGGRAKLDNLPAGAWRVTVTAPDGRTWSGTAVAVPGAPSELKLESPPTE